MKYISFTMYRLYIIYSIYRQYINTIVPVV